MPSTTARSLPASRQISDARAYHLLEAFAAEIADALVAEFPVTAVRVRVRKPDVVLDPPVEHAAVRVERRGREPCSLYEIRSRYAASSHASRAQTTGRDALPELYVLRLT